MEVLVFFGTQSHQRSVVVPLLLHVVFSVRFWKTTWNNFTTLLSPGKTQEGAQRKNYFCFWIQTQIILVFLHRFQYLRSHYIYGACRKNNIYTTTVQAKNQSFYSFPTFPILCPSSMSILYVLCTSFHFEQHYKL